MAKTKEELEQLKSEYESLNNKLKELTSEELSAVVGGIGAEDHNIFVTGEFKNNNANGNGGAIYFEP